MCRRTHRRPGLCRCIGGRPVKEGVEDQRGVRREALYGDSNGGVQADADPNGAEVCISSNEI